MMTKKEIATGGSVVVNGQVLAADRVDPVWLNQVMKQAILAIELAEKLEKYEPTLKPCPFCGGDGHVWDWKDGLETLWQVECIDCECVVGERYKTKEEAIALWNTRVGE